MLQTKNNSPDLIVGDHEHMLSTMVFVIPCTVVNVILLKAIILALVNKEFRNVLADEVISLKINPKVAQTLQKVTKFEQINLRIIENAAFRR